jgi:hypothetical protein
MECEKQLKINKQVKQERLSGMEARPVNVRASSPSAFSGLNGAIAYCSLRRAGISRLILLLLLLRTSSPPLSL